MGKYRWDKVEKKYGLCMYFTEALTIFCLVFYFLSRDIFIGVLAVLLAVCTATFHILLQNYSLNRRVVELLEKGNPKTCGDGKDG